MQAIENKRESISYEQSWTDMSREITNTLQTKIKDFADTIAKRFYDKCSISELTQACLDEGRGLLAVAVESVLDSHVERLEVPEGSVRRGNRARKIRTLVGEINHERPLIFNKENASISYPSDDLLSITSDVIQADIKRKIDKLAIHMPIEEAKDLFYSTIKFF